MTDGEALLRAVCAAPREDLPRLVYADWLEENGQGERAEFIRIQCEAQDYCRLFPSLADARTHASRLARTLGDRWYAELPKLDGVGWSCLWVRGFIDTAWVRDPKALIGSGERLFNATPLLHVSVDGVTSRNLDTLLTSPYLGRLASFSFSHARLTKAELGRIVVVQRQLPDTRIEAYGPYQRPYFTAPQRPR
jgi:uncharacterized protein (TIGR02996 family)